MKEYFNELIDSIKKNKLSKDELSRLKIKLCSKYKFKKIPTDIEILLKTPIKDIEKVKKYLQTKPTRSLSGVSVVAIMTAPHECPHGKCNICPGGLKSHFGDVPQSYTGTEPATRRAIRNNYDPYLQVFNRLEQYIATGHEPEKIELIIMGGTFISTKKKYRDLYVKYAFKAMNDFSRIFYKKNKFNLIKFKKFFELPGDIQDEKREKRIMKKLLVIKNQKTVFLESEQKKNETSNIRCVGLTIETRPDYGLLKHGNEMLRLGCTRVEVGIQSVYDESLTKIERGHSVADNIKSIATLKDLGFKINTHYMPGLFVPYKKDLEGMKQLFSNPDFKPDMLKIYPCMVVPGTKLEKLYKQKKFNPLTTKQAAKLIAEFKQFVPKYCRIMRVQRDIPTYVTTAGVDKTNLRQYIQKEMKEKNIICNCIRCREIGRSKKSNNNNNNNNYENNITISYNIIEYEASNGIEFFISADKGKHIVGFCRLRFPNIENQLRKEITNTSSIVRELHVYGETLSIGQKGKHQHKGVGKKLLNIAEKISKKYNKNKIIVISGIGVRQYYRKLGYKKQGPYMIKKN
jgi:elongator complex protein 3